MTQLWQEGFWQAGFWAAGFWGDDAVSQAPSTYGFEQDSNYPLIQRRRELEAEAAAKEAEKAELAAEKQAIVKKAAEVKPDTSKANELAIYIRLLDEEIQKAAKDIADSNIKIAAMQAVIDRAEWQRTLYEREQAIIDADIAFVMMALLAD